MPGQDPSSKPDKTLHPHNGGGNEDCVCAHRCGLDCETASVHLLAYEAPLVQSSILALSFLGGGAVNMQGIWYIRSIPIRDGGMHASDDSGSGYGQEAQGPHCW